MHAKELAVHERRQRHTIERLHGRHIHLITVLAHALHVEGEVLSQLAALVVATHKGHCGRKVQLERPQVQHTL